MKSIASEIDRLKNGEDINFTEVMKAVAPIIIESSPESERAVEVCVGVV